MQLSACKVLGSDIKTDLKSSFCAILKNKGAMLQFEINWLGSSSGWLACQPRRRKGRRLRFCRAGWSRRWPPVEIGTSTVQQCNSATVQPTQTPNQTKTKKQTKNQTKKQTKKQTKPTNHQINKSNQQITKPTNHQTKPTNPPTTHQ